MSDDLVDMALQMAEQRHAAGLGETHAARQPYNCRRSRVSFSIHPANTHTTYSVEEYNRKPGDAARLNSRTDVLMINRELYRFKTEEMEVHPESKRHTSTESLVLRSPIGKRRASAAAPRHGRASVRSC